MQDTEPICIEIENNLGMNDGKFLRNWGFKWDKRYKNRIGKGRKIIKKAEGAMVFELWLLLANNQ